MFPYSSYGKGIEEKEAHLFLCYVFVLAVLAEQASVVQGSSKYL